MSNYTNERLHNMASVNKVILIGNLGAEPEQRFLPSGDAVCNFSVATTDKWKDKGGAQQEKTEWHNISTFGKLAEICAQYLKKGSAVYVEGSIHTRKWQDKEGQDRYRTEIKASSMQMLGAKSEAKPQSEHTPKKSSGGGFDDMPDDIPF